MTFYIVNFTFYYISDVLTTIKRFIMYKPGLWGWGGEGTSRAEKYESHYNRYLPFLSKQRPISNAVVMLLFTQFSSENFRVMCSKVHTFAYFRATVYVSASFTFLSLNISIGNIQSSYIRN